MNVLTVVSPFQNYRLKLLELMSLTAVSMTLALGIMDELDQSSVETGAASSLSALIIAVNVVFALYMLSEVVAEVIKKIRKKRRTKQLWKSARLKKDLLIAILRLGSRPGGDTSSSSSDITNMESVILPSTQAQECTIFEIEMSDVSHHEDILQQWPEAPGAVDDGTASDAAADLLSNSLLPDFEAPAAAGDQDDGKGTLGWKRLANTPAVKIKAARCGLVLASIIQLD